MHTVKKNPSWTSLGLGKYFNVCFAQEFVLAALVVALVTGCIGNFFNWTFRRVFTKLSHLHCRTKAKLYLINVTSQHQSFSRLDPMQGKLMFPLKAVTLSWTVMDHWVWSITDVNCSGQRCKHPSPLEIAFFKAKLKKLLLCLALPSLFTKNFAINITVILHQLQILLESPILILKYIL